MVKHAPFAKEHVQNYRPISLLPIVSKVLERCVLNGTKAHLYQVISPLQHGFCTGRSCVTNLLEAFDYIGSLLDSGSQVDTIYLDMSKAFNKVSHIRLIHKLSLDGFGGKLLNWFHSYLSGRRQRVTVLGNTSKDLPVTSGVSQGSILGPALFLLYVKVPLGRKFIGLFQPNSVAEYRVLFIFLQKTEQQTFHPNIF